MRLKYFFLSCIIMSQFLFCKYSSAQFGIRGGVNYYNVVTKDKNGNEIYDSPKFNTGFHLGLTYDLPVGKHFFLQPSAIFTTKGYGIFKEEEFSSDQSNIMPYYIELPINLLFMPELGNGKLVLGAGPYFAYGLGGKGKYTNKLLVDGTIIPSVQSANLQFVNDMNDLAAGKWIYGKPLDYGFQILVGYKFNNRLSFQLTGQSGLANIYPKTAGVAPANKLKNRGFSLSVGYTF